MSEIDFEKELKAVFGNDAARMEEDDRIKLVAGRPSDPFVTVVLVGKRGKAFSPERPMLQSLYKQALQRRLVV